MVYLGVQIEQMGLFKILSILQNKQKLKLYKRPVCNHIWKSKSQAPGFG